MSFGSSAVVKAGTIQAWGGNTAPDGWLICDGSAISRSLYSELFNVIGENYGSGDGTTTFNIPDGKVAIGSSVPVAISTNNTKTTVVANSVERELKIYTSGTNNILRGAGSSMGSNVTEYTAYFGQSIGLQGSGNITQASAASNAIIKY